MHGQAGVAELRLRPHGAEGDRAVLDVDELVVAVLALDLDVREYGLTLRAPVDDVVVAVDQPVFPETNERLPDRAREPWVHREALTRPIARGAQASELPDDLTARLFLPLPGTREISVTAEVFLPLALGGEDALEDHVNGDRGVVGAGQPERVEAVHALHARQGVLQGHREGVTPVERPRDVGRRHRDRVRLSLRDGIGAEVAALLLQRIPALLDRSRIVPVRDVAGRPARLWRGHGHTGPAATRRHRPPLRWKVSAQGASSAVAATETDCGFVRLSAASHATAGCNVGGSRRRTCASATSFARRASSPAASASKSCATVARSSRCQALTSRPARRTSVPLSGAARNTSSTSVCPSHPGVWPG